MQGWISLNRAVLNHWVSKDAEYFKAWVTILLEVNHGLDSEGNLQISKVPIGGELISCGRGQSINSLGSWAKLFKWSVQRVRTFFKLLESEGMIVTEGLRKTTRLTVCNYDIYQKQQQADNKQTTSRQHSDNKEITTNNNDNNESTMKNNENKKEILSDFEKFWTIYPKRNGKKLNKPKALAYWKRHVKNVKDSQPYLDAVKEYEKHTRTTNTYPCDAHRFLNNEMWREFLPDFDLSVLPQQVQDNLENFGGEE